MVHLFLIEEEPPPSLNNNILNALGANPIASGSKNTKVNDELVVRWQSCLTGGVNKDK